MCICRPRRGLQRVMHPMRGSPVASVRCPGWTWCEPTTRCLSVESSPRSYVYHHMNHQSLFEDPSSAFQAPSGVRGTNHGHLSPIYDGDLVRPHSVTGCTKAETSTTRETSRCSRSMTGVEGPESESDLKRKSGFAPGDIRSGADLQSSLLTELGLLETEPNPNQSRQNYLSN